MGARGGAGASKTFPIRAGEVRKGGHAKADIVGLDVFTGKKYQDLSPTSHNMIAPVMFRSEWQLTDIEMPAGTMTLMDANGKQRQDLDLPKTTQGEWSALSNTIMTRFNGLPGDKAAFCVVLKAMDTEQVIDLIVK